MNCIADGFWFKLGTIAAEAAVSGGVMLLFVLSFLALVFFSRRGK